MPGFSIIILDIWQGFKGGFSGRNDLTVFNRVIFSLKKQTIQFSFSFYL